MAGFILLLAISVRLVVRVPAVQTWLVQRVVAYLSSELDTKVSVGYVDIKLFRSVVLKELYVEDQQKDTLLYTAKFEAKVSRFDWTHQVLVLKSVTLDKARIGITHYKSPREYNMDFIIRYFAGSNTDTTTTSNPWKVKVENIYLNGSILAYKDLKYTDTTRCIDWEDIYLTKLNLHLINLEPSGDSLSFDIEKISFHEKSGFEARDFESRVTIRPESMSFRRLHITTPFSEVNSDLTFKYESIDDFQDFIEKVRMEGEFKESVISANDLCYFASELFDVDRKVAFHGKVKGTVARFKARDVEVRYSPNTYFRGTVNMTGLPDFDETYMEIGVEDLSLCRSDLLTIPVIPAENGKLLNIPENLESLGVMKFKGKFNGFYNDFVAYGNISTALGFANTDINLKISDDDRNSAYRGVLKMHDFNLGQLLRDPELGSITSDLMLKGKGFELKNVDASLDGTISRIDLHGYSYSGIKIGGLLKKKLFTGNLLLNDPNINLTFNGEIDLSRKLPQYNFEASVKDANLTKLNLLHRDSTASFSGDMVIHMAGNSIDNAQGTIELNDIKYTEGSQIIAGGQVSIESTISDRRELKLRSDFADATMSGDFTLSDLGKSLQWIIATYVPAIHKQATIPHNQDITFRANIKNVTSITQVFFPYLQIASGTSVEGSINTNEQKLSMLFNSNRIKVSDIEMRKIEISGSTDDKEFRLKALFDDVIVNDSIDVTDLTIDGTTNSSAAAFDVFILGRDSSRSKADFRLNSSFPREGMASVNIIPRILKLNNVVWNLDSANRVEFDANDVKISNMRLNSNNQEFFISGIIGKDTSDHLQIQFTNFLAEQLNPILMQYDVNLGGRVNGTASLTALYSTPIIESDLFVDTLRWYADTLGNAEVKAKYDFDQGVVDVNATVTRGGNKNIDIKGKYLIGEKEDALDFTILLQKTYLSSFSHYLEGLFSNVSGVASAKLKLKGPANNPDLTGKVTIQKAGLTVDYLKTAYTFSAELDLDQTNITARNVVLNDIFGNQGMLNANVYHNHLRDFYLDIDINPKNMQVLNTSLVDNDLFYGQAFASGNVSITGYIDNIAMNIGLKSEKNTRINLPLSNPEEVSQSNFITFIKHDSTLVQKDTSDMPDFTGITLNMDFEVTPEATIAIIFDDKIGDVIEGSGKGNLSMTVSPKEDLRMFGNIEIVQGKYLFTMQNVINKPFVISPGGYLRWNGDPYDADIKIDAIYKIKTGLYDLFQDSTFKKLVAVDLELHLKDKLFNPAIAFDITVQNVDPTIDNQVKRLINTEEEKYRQAMALLVMRRFVPPSEYSNRAPVNSGGVVGANAYELLSNQLTNWVNQISSQVNVGVNYRPGDAITSEELEIALSTSILNDRVTIDVNGGYANTTTSNNQNTSNLIGDFNVEVKASKDGRIRLKAFNRSNNNSLINNVNSPYTQGVGIFYREEFNTFGELLRKYRNLFRRKSARVPVNTANQ